MFTIFAATYIFNSGQFRLYAMGFFYALLQTIYGFVPPRGALMRPLLLSVSQRERQNRFLFFCQTNNFSTVMTYTETNCLSVNNSTQQTTPDCESVKSNVLLPRQKLTVSETTYAYLKCLQQLDTLWSCMCEALELNYGWSQTDKIMNDEYHEKSCAVRDMINYYMCASISENINSRDGITEI